MSCGCVGVMKKRKVAHVIHGNLFSVENKIYDTLLMLMNGLGICGSIDGLNLFFQFNIVLLIYQKLVVKSVVSINLWYKNLIAF